MDSFTNCVNALRALSADASLDPASRFLAAARVIRHYLEQAGSNIRKRQSMLSKLNSEIAAMEDRACLIFSRGGAMNFIEKSAIITGEYWLRAYRSRPNFAQ